MNTFLTVLCLALVASASAQPAYHYQQPNKVQSGGAVKQQSFRPSQPISDSGIYSVAQSAPISSYNVQSTQQTKQNYAPQPVDVPAASQYTQQFVAPAPQYVAPVQQQFAAQQQQPQFATPVQQQQQFVAPVQQQQQFAGPVQQQFPGPVQQQFPGPVPQQFPGAVQQQFSGPVQQPQFVSSGVVSQPQYQTINYQPPQPTIISKDIYIHSAPEETEEIGRVAADQPSGPVRKNYRIVFIKAPSQNVKLNLDAIKHAQASNEEKTVIYVLSKKPDLSAIQSQLATVQNDQKSHKPEVYFIKYKTLEEANRAQQEIQAQYDSLGGSTHISDEGIAPVTSVIGGGAINVGSLGANLGGISSGASTGQQQFVQQSYQTSQTTVGGPSSTVSFNEAAPQKYLAAKKKK